MQTFKWGLVISQQELASGFTSVSISARVQLKNQERAFKDSQDQIYSSSLESLSESEPRRIFRRRYRHTSQVSLQHS